MFFKANSTFSDRKVHVQTKVLAVCQPEQATGLDLCHCLKQSFTRVEIKEWRKKLVAFGCDGASANLAQGDLRGLLEADVPWVVMFWCFSHRLELALKDSLKANQMFKDLNDSCYASTTFTKNLQKVPGAD